MAKQKEPYSHGERAGGPLTKLDNIRMLAFPRSSVKMKAGCQ